MSGTRSKHKTLIITDDEEESVKDQEQLNPFSFKEFLRSKNLDSDPDQTQDLDLDLDLDQTQDLDLDPDQTQDLDLGHEEPTLDQFKEQAWGRSWVTGGGASAAQEEEVTRFDSRLRHNDDEDDESRLSYEGDDETSVLESESRTMSGLQQVKRENQQLKKTIKELRLDSLRNKTRVSELSAELMQWRQREQQEALDLETMVQSVENNLRVMTKRAQKAEATVSRLRSDVKQLQIQVEQLQMENTELKASESELVLTMKQNALTASTRLQETVSHAHNSLSRLLSEAESLKFVSELLRSIDRISSVR